MTENMKKIMEMVSARDDLKAKTNELAKQAGDDREKAKALFRAFALEQGITLTDEDFSADGMEMSEDELQAVAGGLISCVCYTRGTGAGTAREARCYCNRNGTGGSECFCVAWGNGNAMA